MTRSFQARGRTIDVHDTALMGIVNASPESFSGDGRIAPVEQAELALATWDAGALIVDVGGQSANTKTPELAIDDEIGRLVPLIEAIRAGEPSGHHGIVSVDTYKPAVADACLAAGADVINDVSGLLDPALADVIARWDAGYVLMHTVGAPKTKVLDPDLYDDVVAAVLGFFEQRLAVLEAAGVPRERVVLDPGLDFGKTPRQSLDLVARADELHAATDRPLLFAISRKDFIGAIAQARPLDRDPGTLAVVGALDDAAPDSVVRVHDVAGVAQFLAVRSHIDRPGLLDPHTDLAETLRRQQVAN